MLMQLAEKIGTSIRVSASGLFYACGFFLSVLKESVGFFKKYQGGYKVLVMQLLFTGIEALGIIFVLSFSIGTVLIIQGYSILSAFGQIKLLYVILVVVITRELGPLLTAFIIIARSGTAIATELGGMVVNHEIEAYTSVGINPIGYLVAPRFLGMVFSMIILTVYFNFFGLVLSYLAASFIVPIPISEYAQNLAQALSLWDIAISLIKSMVFGSIISISASHYGLMVQGSSTEIPQAGIKAVGNSFLLIIISNVLLTILYYVSI
jgi:phospholipid/cholesterol/gamma-HCH transport system permease protein